jgi:hypothetical protein
MQIDFMKKCTIGMCLINENEGSDCKNWRGAGGGESASAGAMNVKTSRKHKK